MEEALNRLAESWWSRAEIEINESRIRKRIGRILRVEDMDLPITIVSEQLSPPRDVQSLSVSIWPEYLPSRVSPQQYFPIISKSNSTTPLSQPGQLSNSSLETRERERKGREKSLIFSFRLIFESRNPRFRFRLRTPGSHDYSRKHARARRDKSISSDFLEVHHHRASYFPSATASSQPTTKCIIS